MSIVPLTHNASGIMEKISKQLIECFKNGGKVLICGNGGSASMAQHMAAEFVCSFEKKDRPPLPAIALTTNSSIMTAWSNDTDFDNVFSRQVAALGNLNDILIGLSTSGKSRNVIYACLEGKSKGLVIINFPRKGKNTAEIQEYQLHLMHKICREVERTMFP